MQDFRRWVIGCIVVNVLWAIGCGLPGVFMCVPINVLWTKDPPNPGRCINYRNLFYASLSIETALNSAVLILPVQQVMRLQLQLKSRLVLAGIFIIGSL